MFPGYPERVGLEMNKLAPEPGMVNVVAEDDRYYNVWKGAAIVSNLPNFKWVSCDDYNEDNDAIFA